MSGAPPQYQGYQQGPYPQQGYAQPGYAQPPPQGYYPQVSLLRTSCNSSQQGVVYQQQPTTVSTVYVAEDTRARDEDLCCGKKQFCHQMVICFRNCFGCVFVLLLGGNAALNDVFVVNLLQWISHLIMILRSGEQRALPNI